uniref:SWIM-type domain-containing protein n=1 Tax=Triticum urartu TaxID=4572 RepID=A0A8R7Q3N5_TRIUA
MWKISSLKQHIQEDMFANVTIAQVKRAKKILMKKWLDARKGQYSRIFDYQLELLRSNPGSTVEVKLEPNQVKPIFQRIYICLEACKKGFMAGCRKVIGLDGCFFKGATNGELLCVVGRDANNQMYPLAWAVVEKENNDSWDWFCSLLFRDVNVLDGEGWVIISDQQKGIITTVSNWAPRAKHRNCARHIYANWRMKFKNKEWQKPFWACAKAASVSFFNYCRAKLAQLTVLGSRAMLKTDPKHWCRAWFKLGSNCDSVDNNMCESFNKWIVEARFLPILFMLETIRRMVMVKIQENRDKCEKWDDIICPNINKKLSKAIDVSGICHAVSNGNNCFEVQHGSQRFTVDLNQMTYSCRYWQLSGIVCAHAVSAIHQHTNQLHGYVASCYSVEAFKKTYAYYLQPVEGPQGWPESDKPKPLAPGYVKMPGRPRKERKREGTEKPKATKVSRVGTLIRCRKCKCTGHNKTTCPGNAASSSNGAATVGQNAASGNAARSFTKSRSNAKASKMSSSQANVKTSQQSTSRKRASTTDENFGPMQKRENKSLGLPKHKMKASSNIAVKNVTVNVQ